MFRETANKPRATSDTLEPSASILDVKIHEGTIRNKLNKHGLFGRVVRRKPLLSKEEHGSMGTA